ncbi:MAG: NifU family protein [Euryarchaeota archaeon]|nr:NifU family protein [Euryarchaeota archaeon]
MANIKEKIEPVIKKIRPMLQAEDGDIKLVDVEDDGTVKVQLVDECAGCAMSQYTLKIGVDRLLIKEVHEVKVAESV